MKRLVAFALILALLSVGSFCMIGSVISEEKANVEITENVLFGNRSYAEGVRVMTRAGYDDHLFWNTTHTIGESSKTETDFEFHYFEHYDSQERNYSGITLDVYLKYGLDLRTPPDECKGLQKAYRELYDATPQGSTGKKMIRLQDYYDYYPVRVSFDLPGIVWQGNDYDSFDYEFYKNERAVWDKFNEYFKIPIPEDLPGFEISITKGIDSIGASGFAIDYYFNATSTFSDSAIFFAIRNKYSAENGKDEQYIDTSRIPGGYGIYCLNYQNVRDPDKSEGSKTHLYSGYETGIVQSTLTTVFPLEQHQEVIYMTMSNDNKSLLVFTLEHSIMYLTVIDVEAMSQKQKIKIGEIDQYSFHELDECIVIRGVENIAVIDKEADGHCRLAFAVKRNSIDKNHSLTGYATAMAFDGERLVIVERAAEEHRRTPGLCGFEVAVYISSGLVYFGEYHNSISSASDPGDYTTSCDLIEYSVTIE